GPPRPGGSLMRRLAAAVPFAVAATLAATVRARAQEPRTVTLAEATQLAVRDQPTMVQARQDVRVADFGVRQSLAAFLPSLTSTLNTSKSGGNRVNQFGQPVAVASYYSSTLGVNLNWD